MKCYVGSNPRPDAICETLLYYDSDGVLAGMFEYFPNDVWLPFPPHLRNRKDLRGCKYRVVVAGAFYIIVNPARQRKGIGTKLLSEATKRWRINFNDQEYSKAGDALVNRFLKALVR